MTGTSAPRAGRPTGSGGFVSDSKVVSAGSSAVAAPIRIGLPGQAGVPFGDGSGVSAGAAGAGGAGGAGVGRWVGRGRLARLGAQLGVTAGAVALWWLACSVLWADNHILASMGPVTTWDALWQLIVDGSAAGDVVISLRRLGTGLLIATLIGVPVGLLLGTSPRVDDATAPFVQFVRMLSPLAWAPAAVALFGIGNAPVVFLVAIATVFPVILGTAAGVRALDPGWAKVAESLGATRLERLRIITLPGVRPNVLVSLRMALGVGWVVLVPAEMLGVTSGLGYAVLNARDQLAYDQLAATMVLIGVTGYVIDLVFRRLLTPRRSVGAP